MWYRRGMDEYEAYEAQAVLALAGLSEAVAETVAVLEQIEEALS